MRSDASDLAEEGVIGAPTEAETPALEGSILGMADDRPRAKWAAIADAIGLRQVFPEHTKSSLIESCVIVRRV